MLERGLNLVHFFYDGDISDPEALEYEVNGLNGVDSIDIITDDKVIYISFDPGVVNIDSIIEVIQNKNIKINY